MDDEILTLAQAGEILKLTEKQGLELCRQRTVERMQTPFLVIRLHRRCLRVKKSDLMTWVSQMGRA